MSFLLAVARKKEVVDIGGALKEVDVVLRNPRLLVALACLTGILGFASARAQDLTAERVQDAMDITDHRIELAVTLVPDNGNASATLELGMARTLQARARSAFASNLLGMAIRATLDARTHADRAIAIVRGLPDPDRVVVQVERTRELLDRARERLANCELPRAQGMLSVALEMQVRAETALHDSRYLAALQLTMSARERAYRALRLCNVADTMQESASRALQRTGDVLLRARETVDGSGSSQARDILARAETVQTEAQAEFRAERFEAALRLTQDSRVMAQRAQRVARHGGSSSAR
jgi:hypothetical protein